MIRVRFEPERRSCSFFWSPERRSGPFRHIALFGSKMPSASGGLRPPDQGLCPWTPLGAPPPDPHISSRSRVRHILSVPVLFLTGNEPWVWFTCWHGDVNTLNRVATVICTAMDVHCRYVVCYNYNVYRADRQWFSQSLNNSYYLPTFPVGLLRTIT